MNIKEARKAAIRSMIRKIQGCLKDGITDTSLDDAKAKMLCLAAKSELFARSDFPVPDGDLIDRTFLIYEEPDGSYALYVNSSLPGQHYRPHDHGGAWAIIAAVSGEETHRLYSAKGEAVHQISETTVRPGSAIALGPNGIHSIHAMGMEPLLHLHLYGVGFAQQGERREYDIEKGSVRAFVLENIGFVEDVR